MDPVRSAREQYAESPCERCSAWFGADGRILKQYRCCKDAGIPSKLGELCKKELMAMEEPQAEKFHPRGVTKTNAFTKRGDLADKAKIRRKRISTLKALEPPLTERDKVPPFDPELGMSVPYNARPHQAKDMVINPAHYAQHAIQPKEFILKNKLTWAQGSVVKYVCRYNLKDGRRDLEKAREFIDIMIEEWDDEHG